MAFNQPIEADRPEDLGLLTAFYRAPVIGTLMWILGGDMAKKLDEEERKESEEMISSSKTPDRISSDVSECSIDAINEDFKKKSYQTTIHETFSCSSEDQAMRNFSLSRQYQETSNRTLTKRISWSDESHQSLVEYFNESSSREPPSASRPIKSVMKRSKSSNVTHVSSLDEIRRRYIPSGMDKKEGGIVFPGGGMKPIVGSGYSPQWGWYISTTPPQEIHGNKKPTTEREENVHAVINDSNSSIAREAVNRKESSPGLPLPIFKQNVTVPSHGWPNVPL